MPTFKAKFDSHGRRCPQNERQLARLPECGAYERSFQPHTAPKPRPPHPPHPYDVCVNTPPDQLEEMKRRIAVNPGKHANPCGGVLQTA